MNDILGIYKFRNRNDITGYENMHYTYPLFPLMKDTWHCKMKFNIESNMTMPNNTTKHHFLRFYYFRILFRR
jgi:hypothetical protein